MMLNRLNNMMVLRYPEPADVGGGGSTGVAEQQVSTEGNSSPADAGDENAAAEQADDSASASVEDVNPFDFTVETEGDSPQTDAVEDAGSYDLNLGESFSGTDETRSMIAAHAKANNISADAAGAFVTQVCDSLAATQKEADKQALADLRGEWKGDFDSNMSATKRFIADAVKNGGISAEDAQFLMNPHVFRFANVLRGSIGEGRTQGTAEAAAVNSRQSEIDDIINNPDNVYHKQLFNPGSKGYKAAAAHFNSLVGAKIY